MREKGNRPAVFFDRDGVLIVDKGYQVDPQNIEFFPDTLSALRSLDSVFRKFVISNQSGISRGFFSEDDVLRFNDRLARSLAGNQIIMDQWYFCPHLPDDNCSCRKPRPGMILKAAADFDLDLPGSWIVGDKSSDILAGREAGLRTILVATGYAGREEGYSNVTPDFSASNITEAVDLINRSMN